MDAENTLDRQIAARIRSSRLELGMTLDELAEKSGVSRAMISRIERAESSPTAALLFRICGGLGITLSSLMATAEIAPQAISRRSSQPVWRDPETGYSRRMISPHTDETELELTEIELPAGADVRYGSPSGSPYRHQIYILKGTLSLEVHGEPITLTQGDCIDALVNGTMRYTNRTKQSIRYIVAQSTRSSRPTSDRAKWPREEQPRNSVPRL